MPRTKILREADLEAACTAVYYEVQVKLVTKRYFCSTNKDISNPAVASKDFIPQSATTRA